MLNSYISHAFCFLFPHQIYRTIEHLFIHVFLTTRDTCKVFLTDLIWSHPKIGILIISTIWTFVLDD